MPHDKYDCEACRGIWRMFSDPEFSGPVKLGSFQDVASSSCEVHGPLVRAFAAENTMELADSTDIGFVKYGPGKMYLVTSIKYWGVAFWPLLLVAKKSVGSHPGLGRILNTKWADLDLVRTWKDICLTSHGTTCESPMKIPYIQPDLLIDTAQKCLVRGSGVLRRYTALSYIMGAHQQKTMSPTFRAQLFEPGSLARPCVQEYLDPIIRHAMQLTGRIGERYLWADALCIDNADHESMKRQLQAMAAIYSSAIVTIINVDATSRVGISGLQGISDPRAQNQRVFPFGKEEICVRNTDVVFMPGFQEYFKRCWTYQEYTLPSRSLVFLANEVHWQCQCTVWHEELTRSIEAGAVNADLLRTLLAGFPDLWSLSAIIGNYNNGSLTYEEDALPAISGLLSVISRSFDGGFLFGIPEMFFEQCLGWQPVDGYVNLKRRIPSTRPAALRLPCSDLPSWSWVGWQGPVEIKPDAAQIDPAWYEISETYPITVFYCGQSPNEPPSKRRMIKSTWYTQRADRKDFTKPLPPGWTQHDISEASLSRDEPFLHPIDCGRYIFRHKAMCDPNPKRNYWYYPFPVATITPSTPPFTPEQWPYLFCKTQRVYLYVYTPDERNIACLCDTSGSTVGQLHLHNHESRTLFPREPIGKEVELVALYKSTHSTKTFDEEKEVYGHPICTTDYICVLWIEWEDGVALRRACGSVLSSAWAKMSFEDIDLVLG